MRIVAIVGIVLGVAAAAGAALPRVEVFFTNRGQDFTVAQQGCLPWEDTRAAALGALGGESFMLYTCHDPAVGLTVVRAKHLAVVGSAPAAPPVPAASCAHIPGFVSTRDGAGCVPVGHPLAR